MLLAIFLVTINMIFFIILVLLSLSLSQIKENFDKFLPYECGFSPVAPSYLPLSLRFFLIAILFLLFDLEIALLLPLPWVQQYGIPSTMLFWVFALLFFLLLGFAYEWSQGGLEWAE